MALLEMRLQRDEISSNNEKELSLSSQDNTLESIANRVAKRDLVKLARHGMEQHQRAMFNYWAEDYEDRPEDRGFLYGWLPRAVADERDSCVCAGGLFFDGMNLPELLRLCLTDDALALLLKHSCNEYLFWQNIDLLVGSVFIRSDAPRLPFTFGYLHHRLVEDRWRETSKRITELKNLVSTEGDNFDPGQLDAAEAVDLLRQGILLLVWPRVLAQPSKLVVNPALKLVCAQSATVPKPLTKSE
jgi:hypothetical protein